MPGRNSSRIKPSYWAIAWSLSQFRSAAGELTTSFLPRQAGYPQGGHGSQVTPPWLTCSGHADYDGCAPWLGAGCCSQGLSCQSGGLCVADSTTSTTVAVQCDQGWFACPSSQGGGCCIGGQVCGSGVCTAYMPSTTTITGTIVSTITSESVSSQISPNLTSMSSTIIAGTETVTQLSRAFSWWASSGSAAGSQAGATSTGSSSTASQTAASSSGGSLKAGQIGGISAGVVVGFLLLVALGWLLVRHLMRISRFMDKFTNHPRDQSEQSAIQGEDGTNDSELKIPDDGNDATGGNGQPLPELSPQERPQLLEEWGRHGSRGNELSGGEEAHGVSELDGTSVPRQ